MEPSQISRVPVADQAASILRQRILNGELRPGTAVQEVHLAASLGVSRNTMREATRVLCSEGLLKRSNHRGITVAQLSPMDVKEIYHVRRLLEIPGVLAAGHGDAKILSDLRMALEGYEQMVKARDWIRAVSFDLNFHTLLIGFHRNRRLEAFYQKIIGELRMGMVLVDRLHDDPEGLGPVHHQMYELLAGRKLHECAKLLAQHLDDSETRLTAVMSGPAGDNSNGQAHDQAKPDSLES
ncbi:MAG TPA: GntR family transcriptional regulator [Candidatus Sulfotelmatobacter sp.]|nr:GntR family transcriptional regulator [Candidatus Sulfotelmatobacter sp.]